MAKQIISLHIEYDGTMEDGLTTATISYQVSDTQDPDLRKASSILVEDSPSTVDWADAVSRINAKEGIS